ncbi:YetF domain-containing protein [Viridibacillus sp. NPDC096237]|uniref:YetF domain-containing protein n=1 Tax=Viridibacillus sp. NPDC096237 TaxID=3390721 RepID=UPI003CFC2573
MDKILEINFWEMILRTTVSFLVLLLLARWLGKKQLGQLTFFHYITGITIGSTAAEIAAQHETPFIDGLISLIWWTILTIFMSFVALKSPKMRVLINDSSTVIIKNGELSVQALKSSRLHMDDLIMMLREQSIYSIQDVQYAILETNGRLSVLKKPAEQGATKQDVKADVSIPPHMPMEVIADGAIVWNTMEELNLTEEWLMRKLRKKEIESVQDVYYAQLQPNGSLYITVRDKDI